MRGVAVLVALAVVCGAVAVCGAAETVPLLAWAPSAARLSAAAGGSLGQAADGALVAQELVAAAKGGVLAVFVKEELSVEDLSVSGSFAKTQSACEKAGSTYYVPALASAGGLHLEALEKAAAAAGAVVAKANAAAVAAGRAAVPADATVLFLALPADDCDATMHAALAKVAAAAGAAEVTAVLVGAKQPLALAGRDATVRRRRAANGAATVGAVSPQPEVPAYVSLRVDQRHERPNVWFTVPILMGMIVGLFIIVVFAVGLGGVASTQTMERWPDAAHDKNLIVPQ